MFNFLKNENDIFKIKDVGSKWTLDGTGMHAGSLFFKNAMDQLTFI